MYLHIRKILVFACLWMGATMFGQHFITGKVSNQQNQTQGSIQVSIDKTDLTTTTNAEGYYKLGPLEKGTYLIWFDLPTGESESENIEIKNQDIIFNYQVRATTHLDGVEIFGERNRAQRGIEQITRFPVSIKDQIQSISVVSEKLIEDQGVTTVTDAVRNVPGVTQFASYGGVRESMSLRGYRGTPVLKNGVRMDSDFRTGAVVSDMSGVESIQVIKGSAALTQGIGDDLGSAGGVINVVTKTPRYRDAAEIGIRTGSWKRTRLQYDAQKVLGANENFGLRIAGAYQAGQSYRDEVKNRRVYVTPSLAWKIDDKTEVVLEMDYLNDHTTPDRGTVNLAPDTEEALYDMGHKFLGFKDDIQKTKNLTYSGTITRKLTDNLNARVGFFSSYYESDQTLASIALFKDSNNETIYNKRNRGLGRSFRNDRNSTVQVDLMGKDMEVGSFKWSWQLGYDYTMSRVDTRTAEGIKKIDVIDVFEAIDNSKAFLNPNYDATKMELGAATITHNYYYGFATQHHFSLTDYLKLVGGLRWSYSIEKSESVIDPFVGLIVSPIKNINIFGSYTTNSSLRSASNPLENGGTVGVSRTKQYEFGVKTNWMNDRLRANVVYFDMNNENLSYQIYDENQTATGLYGLAGNLKRKGVEVELAGRPFSELQIMLGYAYLDAFYEDSPAYMDGSAPSNAPKNTANAWVQYRFSKTALKGFSAGLGVYYVGDRPANEYTKITAVHNTVPGLKYFDMPAYTTLNAQLGYQMNKLDFKVFFNNITDAIGYNSYYRGGFINQIDPFNISAQLTFKF